MRARRGRRRGGTVAVTSTSVALSPEIEETVRTTRERHQHSLVGRERLIGAPFGIALLLAVAALAVALADDRELQVGPALALLAAFVLAARVEFQTGAGYVVPTQIVFVPMLFILPAPAVPLAVGIGYVLARVLRSPRPALGLERIVGEFANAWYTLAPILVITLAHAERPDLSHWPVYVAALAAQMALDLIVTYLRYALAFGTRLVELLRETRAVVRLDVMLAPLGLLGALVSTDAPYAWLLVLPLIGLITGFGHERSALVENQLELSRAYRGTALLLGDVVEDDDEYTGRHSRGVGLLALEVADDLGLNDRVRRDVEFAALLHDVGKVAMPKEIVNKPGPLSPGEWAVMRTHTIEGERMLQRVGGVLDTVGTIVRASHERFDGTGYPDGLAGEQIPLAARIVSCCDAFSAMTTDRPYRAALSLHTAIAELESCAGSQFDPEVVCSLISVVERWAHEAPHTEVTRSERTLDRLAAEVDRAIPIGFRARRELNGTAPLRSLMDALEEGIVVHDADGVVRDCNPSAERILGVRAADLRLGGEAMSGLMIVDANRSPLPVEDHPWQVALMTGRPCSGVTIGIEQVEGDLAWLSVSARPLRRPGRARPHAVVSSIVDVTERRRQEAELRGLVDRDPLTDLYNRRRFEDDLQRQIERSRRFGEEAILLVLDLDEFKAVNDEYGHRVGDAVLRAVADLLRRRLRATDVIARLGGDEFAAVLTHTSREQGAHVARELLSAIRGEQVKAGDSAVPIRASIGLATIDGNAQTDDVLDLADRAMYSVKRGARAMPCPAE
jgi:diguanylate cyclase (GGDEF)-like protein/PAS domain S-box-containing protein